MGNTSEQRGNQGNQTTDNRAGTESRGNEQHQSGTGSNQAANQGKDTQNMKDKGGSGSGSWSGRPDDKGKQGSQQQGSHQQGGQQQSGQQQHTNAGNTGTSGGQTSPQSGSQGGSGRSNE